MDHLKRGPAARGNILVTAATATVFVVAALIAFGCVKVALQERRVASAVTNLRLAAQTVASTDVLVAAGFEAPSADYNSSLETIITDRDLALSTLGDAERTEIEEHLDEMIPDGDASVVDGHMASMHEPDLSAVGADGHSFSEHDHVQALLAQAAVQAEAGADMAEDRAFAALFVTVGAALVATIAVLRRRRELQRLSHTDRLTGLPNRRALDGALHAARSRVESHGGAVGLIFLNIDGFKNVNDTLGTDAGDQLLLQVAERFRQNKNDPGDVILRLDGVEFAVVPGATASDDAVEAAAAAYLQVFDEPFTVDSRPKMLRASIGVSSTTDPDRVTGLTAESDMAVFEAKRSGGNTVAVFDRSMEINSHEANRITRALRSADYDKEFSLVYQPIFTVDAKAVTSVEALLRWNSPSIGQVPPNDFIPVAERSDEIASIGGWVLEKVCAQIQTWDRQGIHQELTVSWNVSPDQLVQPTFVEEVLSTIDKWGIDRDRMVLEVTESAVIEHYAVVVERLSLLRTAGLRVSIDDFGSGYSNLGQLLQVPFDIIKIDRSLLLTLTAMRDAAGGDASSSCAIMGAIVSIASVYQAPVVCEGVETEAQRQSLLASGITHVQGYLTGRPTEPTNLPGGSKPELVTLR